jgi:hypothetical protein
MLAINFLLLLLLCFLQYDEAFICACKRLNLHLENANQNQIEQYDSIPARLTKYCVDNWKTVSDDTCRELLTQISLEGSLSCCKGDEDFSTNLSDTDRLISYLKTRGFLYKNITFAKNKQGVRGVFIHDNTTKGEVLFTVPSIDSNYVKKSKHFQKYLKVFKLLIITC